MKHNPQVCIVSAYHKAYPADKLGDSTDLRTALTLHYRYDALIQACYSAENPYRLNKASVGKTPILQQLAIFDWDAGGAGNKVVPQKTWRQDARAKINAVAPNACIYDTPHGCRFLWVLENPRPINTPTAAERWKAEYECWLEMLKEHGINADESCSEFAKLQRLPFGKRKDLTPDKLEAVGEIKLDLPEEIGFWAPALTDKQLARIEAAVPKTRKTVDRSGAAAISTGAVADTILYELFAMRGWILGGGSNERANVACPYSLINEEHDPGVVSSTAIFATDTNRLGTFVCLHETCAKHPTRKPQDVVKDFFSRVVARATVRDYMAGAVKVEIGGKVLHCPYSNCLFSNAPRPGGETWVAMPLWLAEHAGHDFDFIEDIEDVDTTGFAQIEPPAARSSPAAATTTAGWTEVHLIVLARYTKTLKVVSIKGTHLMPISQLHAIDETKGIYAVKTWLWEQIGTPKDVENRLQHAKNKRGQAD